VAARRSTLLLGYKNVSPSQYLLVTLYRLRFRMTQSATTDRSKRFRSPRLNAPLKRYVRSWQLNKTDASGITTCLHVIARDGDRVEPRHGLGGVGHDVAHNAHARGGGVDVRVADHVLLQDVVLDRTGQLVRRNACGCRTCAFSRWKERTRTSKEKLFRIVVLDRAGQLRRNACKWRTCCFLRWKEGKERRTYLELLFWIVPDRLSAETPATPDIC
jgi:hypothetical protein